MWYRTSRGVHTHAAHSARTVYVTHVSGHTPLMPHHPLNLNKAELNICEGSRKGMVEAGQPTYTSIYIYITPHPTWPRHQGRYIEAQQHHIESAEKKKNTGWGSHQHGPLIGTVKL